MYVLFSTISLSQNCFCLKQHSLFFVYFPCFVFTFLFLNFSVWSFRFLSLSSFICSPPSLSLLSPLPLAFTDPVNVTDMETFRSDWCCLFHQRSPFSISVCECVIISTCVSTCACYISRHIWTKLCTHVSGIRRVSPPAKPSYLRPGWVLIHYRWSWHPSGRELPALYPLSPPLCATRLRSHLQQTLFIVFYLASIGTASVSTAEDNAHFVTMIYWGNLLKFKRSFTGQKRWLQICSIGQPQSKERNNSSAKWEKTFTHSSAYF